MICIIGRVSFIIDASHLVARAHGRARKQRDPREKAPVFQNGLATEKLAQTTQIKVTSTGQDFEKSLGFRREIKSARVFVIINSIYSIPVVKQNEFLLTKVHQHATEPAVEFFEEGATHFFVQVDEITGVI